MSQFGKTWWGQQWLNSLNNIDYSNRLPRGSSYARKGAVTKLNINNNRIHAKVAGSQPTPYNVDIILPPFFDPDLSLFIDALAAKPVIISKLLNRELDPEVLSIAEAQGLKVFPRQWTDFKMQCNCPDWAVPCKHLAAVIYKVCAEIDNNPFLVFSLHNIDLIQELNNRGLLVTKEQTAIPALTDLYFDKEKKPTKKKPEFDDAKSYEKLSFASLSPLHEPLISLLSENPVFYTGKTNFKDKYKASLHRIVRNGRRILQGKIGLEKVLHHAIKEQPALNTHSKNKVTINELYQSKVWVNDADFSIPQFISQLIHIPANKTLDYQPSTAALHTLFHLALHLTANGAIVPQIVQHPDRQYAVRWLPALVSKDVRILVGKISSILPPEIFWWQSRKTEKEINKDGGVNLLSLFITELVHLFEENDSDDVFMNLFFRKKKYGFHLPGEDALSGGIQSWLQKYYITQGKHRPQVVISETTNDKFLTYINVFTGAHANTPPHTLRDVLTLNKFNQQRFEVLQSLAHLIDFIPGLNQYINTKGEHVMEMDMATFSPFLMQMIPVIRLLDIDILLPKSLQNILKPKVSMKVKKKKGKSFLRLDQLLDFDWQVAVGDSLMDEKDFRKLLKQSDTLLKYKSQYIYVNKDDLEKLHKHFSAPQDLSAFQLLRTALSGDYFGAKVELTNEVSDLIKTLSEVKEIPLPQSVKATLRPYQQRGFSWMYRNAQIGFGSVIADDMGLGKTLQVITTLAKYKEEGFLNDKKILVVAPTGLLTNWQAEIEKFAPTLKTHLYHGSSRKLAKGFDILLTSYGIMRTEAVKLKKHGWHTLVIDEAQHIKNYDTAQAKAIKSIGADNFIAMSGTPVENRLSELWSIMDYSNRGLLGNVKEFQENFASPIETYNDATVADKLKKVTTPFMMRRLKTDKTIISDLPDKIEMDSFSTLVPNQASLYEKTLEEALKEIEAIDATDKKGLFVRQGLVLQMILALKQICNHPAQFLKNNRLDASQSGKLGLLFEKLDSIVESGEKVLLFTQFTEMGKMLQHFITERYKEAPLFYHGGCSIKQRKEMVESFQHNHADKIFILSLKAAGTGLNLTAANHVIHYDLWWNPAVEAQATDRAYRIGQKNNVMVHRFITKNTFEERINEMIQSKKALAEMTVATGENWIGNLSNKELKDLFEIK
ncbi:MAG: SNF2-related protein [Niabella sp.]